MEERNNTTPELMLEYLANYIKKLMDENCHDISITLLLEIYFKYSTEPYLPVDFNITRKKK